MEGIGDLPFISSSVHRFPSATQGMMELVKDWLLSMQRHSKSVVEQPALSAADSKQSTAQVGSWPRRSGRLVSVELSWAAAKTAKSDRAVMALYCMIVVFWVFSEDMLYLVAGLV
jgi:hypothetical protein